MPVKKFRTVEELNQPHWRSPGDPGLWRSMAAVWQFGRRTRPAKGTPGVRKFRSIAELKNEKAVR